MLTLQIFSVMDRLWQAEGLDFRYTVEVDCDNLNYV